MTREELAESVRVWAGPNRRALALLSLAADRDDNALFDMADTILASDEARETLVAVCQLAARPILSTLADLVGIDSHEMLAQMLDTQIQLGTEGR